MSIEQKYQQAFNEVIRSLERVPGITREMPWKTIIDKLEANGIVALQQYLYNLRSSFVDEMNAMYCPRGQCFYSGSTTLRSDIDVAIKNKWSSLDILGQIKNCIIQVFSKIYPHNTERKARQFLDLNHYLSNFEITPWSLEKCVLNIVANGKTYYLSSNQNIMQRYFAFAYWKEKQTTFTGRIEASVEQLNKYIIQTSMRQDVQTNVIPQFEDYKAYVRRYQQIIASLPQYDCAFSEQGVPQKVVDDLTNVVSFITRYEDEGYVTQGSFYRWVNSITNLPYHMLLDCIIEHICLAKAHRGDTLSFFKYMSRCRITVDELNDVNVTNVFTGPWWNTIGAYLDHKQSKQNNVHRIFVESNVNNMPSDEDLSRILNELMKARDTTSDYNMPEPFIGGGAKKVRVLGRDRKVYKVGRKSMITYKGKLITLTDARKLDGQIITKGKAR